MDYMRRVPKAVSHIDDCTLMGPRNPRPKYEDGGSLACRRDELLKIAHPVSAELQKSYPYMG
jgi:hypothetical protein